MQKLAKFHNQDGGDVDELERKIGQLVCNRAEAATMLLDTTELHLV